jgi:hypothetical protein
VIARAHRIARAGPSKAAKKPSPGGVHFLAARACQLPSDEQGVALEELSPARVAHFYRFRS